MYKLFQQTDTLWTFWLSRGIAFFRCSSACFVWGVKWCTHGITCYVFEELISIFFKLLKVWEVRNLFPSSLNSWRCDRATLKYSYLCLSAKFSLYPVCVHLVGPSRSWKLFCVAFWWTTRCLRYLLNYDIVFKTWFFLSYGMHICS